MDNEKDDDYAVKFLGLALVACGLRVVLARLANEIMLGNIVIHTQSKMHYEDLVKRLKVYDDAMFGLLKQQVSKTPRPPELEEVEKQLDDWEKNIEKEQKKGKKLN